MTWMSMLWVFVLVGVFVLSVCASVGGLLLGIRADVGGGGKAHTTVLFIATFSCLFALGAQISFAMFVGMLVSVGPFLISG